MTTTQPTPRDHTTAAVTPAHPLLASSLIDTSDLASLLTAITHPPNPSPANLTPHLATPPFRPGALVALSSSAQTQRSRDALAASLLVDCLFEHVGSQVAVVDATGEFDLVGLYARILERVGGAEGGEGQRSREEREGVAVEMLGRVRMMRVFDFVGVKEAIGEVREELEGRGGLADGDGVERDGVEVSEKMVVDEEPAPPPKRTEVADSEDEDEGVEAEDEEMLFDVPVPDEPASTSAPLPSVATPQRNSPEKQTAPNLKLILIDNLAHVLTPLLKKDSIQGTPPSLSSN
jgi:hypothetical protein